MNRDDVRVREAGRHARLADEPLARIRRLREMGREDLDRNVAVELHVAREVDHPHAAATELARKRILAGQGGLQIEEFERGVVHSWNTSGRRNRTTLHRGLCTTKYGPSCGLSTEKAAGRGRSKRRGRGQFVPGLPGWSDRSSHRGEKSGDVLATEGGGRLAEHGLCVVPVH